MTDRMIADFPAQGPMELTTFFNSGVWHVIEVVGGGIVGLVMAVLSWSIRRNITTMDKTVKEHDSAIRELYKSMGAQNEDNAKTYVSNDTLQALILPLFKAQIDPLLEGQRRIMAGQDAMTNRIDDLFNGRGKH